MDSNNIQSAFLEYQFVIQEAFQEWLKDEAAFGSSECREIADNLRSRAIELDAQARDWDKRALRTEALEAKS